MKRYKNSILLSLACLVSFGYHTATHAFLKDLKFWSSGKEEVISLTEKVPESCGISISNIKGDITVKTWKQQKVVIEARKRGSEQAIDATTVKKTLANNRLRIETIYKDPKTKCAVHYDILVPDSARLQSVTTEKGSITIANAQHGAMAKTERGNILLENVTGPVKTSANRGSITIAASELKPENKILAITGRGNIKLTMPESSNADVFLKTTKGAINSEIPITTKSRTMKFNRNTLAQLKREAYGKIGEGGSAIKLHTGSGNINVTSS